MIKIDTFACNDFGELCYVVSDGGAMCFIVDPGMANEGEWQRVKRSLDSKGLTPSHVLLTHCHVDHCMGTGFVKRDYPEVRICGSIEDEQQLPKPVVQARAFGVPYEGFLWTPIQVNLYESIPSKILTEGLGTEVQVFDCPGHSFHGLCYYLPEHKVLFSGDVLFYCSVGRSDFGPEMGCNGRLLAESIVKKLFTLPHEVKVYPGHGPYTTIGCEVNNNPYI